MDNATATNVTLAKPMGTSRALSELLTLARKTHYIYDLRATGIKLEIMNFIINSTTIR